MTVWVVVCCDNVAGVASSPEKALGLSCSHGEDSFCCFTEQHEVDAVRREPWRPTPRHRQPVMQEALPL